MSLKITDITDQVTDLRLVDENDVKKLPPNDNFEYEAKEVDGSKEVANELSKPVPKEISISLSDAYNLITRKIIMNNMSKDCLTKQIEYSGLSVKMQKHFYSIYKQKIEYIDQINTLYEHQLSDYTEERQNIINTITDKINELDAPNYNKELVGLLKKHRDLESDITSMIQRIQNMESTIPETQSINKVKFRVRKTNEINEMLDSCAKDVRSMNFEN